MKSLAPLCAITAIAFATPTAAGVVLEIESKDLRTSKIMHSQVKAEGRQLKMTVMPADAKAKGGRATMIFHADRKEMIVLDDDAKSFLVLNEAAMASMGGQVKDAQGQADVAMDRMKEALENVPEEQRAMIEKMMKDQGGQAPRMSQGVMPRTSPAKLQKAGETKTVNGFATTKYEVYRDRQKTRELWVTGWSEIEGGKEVAALFGEMADFHRDMMASFSGHSGMSGMAPGPAHDAMFEHMKDMEGVPVLTREFEDGKTASESSLQSAKKVKIDAAEFQPPKGYTKRSMMGGKGPK